MNELLPHQQRLIEVLQEVTGSAVDAGRATLTINLDSDREAVIALLEPAAQGPCRVQVAIYRTPDAVTDVTLAESSMELWELDQGKRAEQLREISAAVIDGRYAERWTHRSRRFLRSAGSTVRFVVDGRVIYTRHLAGLEGGQTRTFPAY